MARAIFMTKLVSVTFIFCQTIASTKFLRRVCFAVEISAATNAVPETEEAVSVTNVFCSNVSLESLHWHTISHD